MNVAVITLVIHLLQEHKKVKMKHTLKIQYALILLFAFLYLVCEFIRMSNDFKGQSYISEVLICIVLAGALREIDRRLTQIERNPHGHSDEPK